MQFKDFITRQRVGIFVVGIAGFATSLVVAQLIGFASLWGELSVDLAASAITVIFTALIIDYLGVREEDSKTRNAGGLAEDELTATCFRVEWRMARLFGLERSGMERENISNREEARQYIEVVRQEVDTYLDEHDMTSDDTPLQAELLQKYTERLQIARTELEQTLQLYQYAMSYSLRERVLGLRSELQIADNILGFIDFNEELNEANISLIRILSQSIHDEIEAVLGHNSRVAIGKQIHEKESSLA